MKNVITIILLLIFTGAIPISCGCYTDCGCHDSLATPNNFTIAEFGVRTTNSDNAEIDTTKTYSFDNIFKTIYIMATKNVARNKTGGNSLFINQAIACDPFPPSALEAFQEIKITSLTEIALAGQPDRITAGQDITNRFVIAHTRSTEFLDIGSFIKQASVIFSEDTFRLRLFQRPYRETTLKIKIDILMSNGETFVFDKQIMKAK